jgi:hypothetical protein
MSMMMMMMEEEKLIKLSIQRTSMSAVAAAATA